MRLEDEIKQARFSSPYQKLVLNLMFTGSWVNALSVRGLKPFGLSPQQYNILRILRGQHPQVATIQLIKDRMLDKMSNVSRLVEKLRMKRMVERQTCSNDRRAVDVVITDKGLKLLAELDELEADWHAQLGALDEREAEQLNDLLDKLRG